MRSLIVSLTLTIIIAICFVQCSTTSKSIEDDKRQNNMEVVKKIPEAYKPALEKALRNKQLDDFQKVFKSNGKIELSGNEIKMLNRVKVDTQGNFLILDMERKQAEVYDKTGKYLRPIGNTGYNPGQYLTPTDVIEGEAKTIAISDFTSHRVNIYSSEGKFLRSFIYTPQNFSAGRIFYNQVNKSYYLYGNRWQYDGNKNLTGAELFHKYSAKGDFLESFLQFPDKGKDLDLYSYVDPLVDIQDGVFFIALPFDYTIYRLDSDGLLTKYIEHTDSAFKAPKEKIELPSGNDGKAYTQNWRLSWTPIDSITISGDKLLVQYQTFNPLRYTIDIWSIKNKKKITSLNTNHMLLTRAEDGSLYFLDNIEREGQSHYGLIHATLEL